MKKEELNKEITITKGEFMDIVSDEIAYCASRGLDEAETTAQIAQLANVTSLMITVASNITAKLFGIEDDEEEVEKWERE